MKAHKWIWLGLFTAAGVTASASGQNAAGIAGAAGAPTTAAGAAGMAGGQAGTLWSFLGVSKEQKKRCREECCKTPCGQFINKMFAPLALFSGGIAGQFCPLTPSAEELAKEGAEGAAARIKEEEANAKARRAAVRYLGTVDCIRFPEASDALADALRGDTNECVRYEAALALGSGCCCNKKTMEALAITVACSDRDGKPREYSDRVRAAASIALQNCLSCYVDPNPPKDTPPEKPPEGEQKTGENKATSPDNKTDATAKTATAKKPTYKEYYAKIDEVPKALIVAEARRTMEKYNESASASVILRNEPSLVASLNRATQLPTETMVMENGLPVARAELVSQRPKNLWDMMSREAGPTTDMMSVPSEAMVRSTVEPPSMALDSNTITKLEPVPLSMPKIEPLAIPEKSDKVVKDITPTPTQKTVKSLKTPEVVQTGPYGEQKVIRPKTNAELANQTRGKTTLPAQLPVTVTTEPKPVERQSLKPIEMPKATVATPTPLADRAQKLLTESHPAAARETVVAQLTAADVQSSPALVSTLVDTAKTTGGESTRRAAIKALVRGQANTPEVLTSLEKLTDDPIPGVRVEAAIGLARLKVGK